MKVTEATIVLSSLVAEVELNVWLQGRLPFGLRRAVRPARAFGVRRFASCAWDRACVRVRMNATSVLACWRGLQPHRHLHWRLPRNGVPEAKGASGGNPRMPG